jgi:CHAP domain
VKTPSSISSKGRSSSRELLASIARREAALEVRGNGDKAGPAIERYLAVFRDALNKNCETTRYSDPAVGYNWCCAFVYYCCLQAGFSFPPKPVPSYRYTLAAVPAWHNWAVTEGFFHPGGASEPEPGHIVLFNYVDTGQPLDHMGVVVEVAPRFVLCAEGSVENRTGLFERPYSCIAGYVRLPETAPSEAPSGER